MTLRSKCDILLGTPLESVSRYVGSAQSEADVYAPGSTVLIKCWYLKLHQIPQIGECWNTVQEWSSLRILSACEKTPRKSEVL